MNPIGLECTCSLLRAAGSSCAVCVQARVTELRGQLYSSLLRLGADEHRVLLRIAERLVMGREQYGDLRIANDPRNWREEASAEALDLSVYMAIALLKRE